MGFLAENFFLTYAHMARGTATSITREETEVTDTEVTERKRKDFEPKFSTPENPCAGFPLCRLSRESETRKLKRHASNIPMLQKLTPRCHAQLDEQCLKPESVRRVV